MKASLTTAGLAVATMALAIGGLAGCGSDDDGGDADDVPTTASVEDFCANFERLQSDLSGLGDEDVAKAIEKIKDIADDMEDTGTPEDIPDDARDGFQVTLEAIDDLDDDATADDLSKMDEQFTDEETKNADAFSDYLGKTCDT